MMSPTHRRLTPIACLIFVNGLLLTSLSLLLAATASQKTPKTISSPRIYALLDIGKDVKSVAHEQYRENVRECYTISEMPWFLLQISPAAKLNVVRSQNDAKAWLQKNLHAEYLGKTDLLRIRLSDGSPHEQAVIVDTIIRGELQGIEGGRMRSLKEEIVRSRRHLAMFAQDIITFETELRELDNTVGLNRKELEALQTRRHNMERQLAFAKKSVKYNRALIERDEDLLRNRPRIVKWAANPRPEE